MRHKRLGRKLGVVTKHRKAMLRNMVTDFLRYERIKTTDTRAKELRRLAEKMITLAKEGTLHARRQAAGVIRDKAVLKRLFDEIAPKYKDRPGGYTRIIKLGMRRGDNAPISMLELIGETVQPKRKKKQPKVTQEKQQPVVGTPEAKSRKREAAEELGLIERQEKPKEALSQQAEEVPPQAEEKSK
jgi:large subunit ribosomal protein L17